MFEKLKNYRGKGSFVCAMFMDLSNAFDTTFSLKTQNYVIMLILIVLATLWKK